MKIGIITLPLNTNYGGILQAYALQTILENMGHNVYHIQKRWKPKSLPLWKIPLAYGKRILRNLSGQKWPILYEKKFNEETPVIRQYTNQFIKKYIKCRYIDNYSDIKENEFDVIVVGSDQIFRAGFLPHIEESYLDFAEKWKIKRIAYAVSFGTDRWEYSSKQTKRCQQLLKLFDAVSVREVSGVGLCKEHFGIDTEFVLDPTLLLSTNNYIELFNTTTIPQSPGNLLCYILDETKSKKDFIAKIAKEKNLKPFNVKSKSDIISAPLKERIQPPLEQWLRGFYDADLIITDSFHACVFSILFKKNFFVIGNIERGMARFHSLLKTFGLEDRMINIEKGTPIINANIDFNIVYNKLSLLRNKSNNFLTRNL